MPSSSTPTERAHRLAARGLDSAPCTQGRRLRAEQLPDHRERLFRAAVALCGSREDAEDLVQETFLRVMSRPRYLRNDDDLSYLLRVLRNTWINVYNNRRRTAGTVAFDDSIHIVVDPGPDPVTSVVEIRAVYAAVEQLTAPLREAIVAVDFLGLSYRQAARAVRVREGTIMSRLHRARGAVADALEQADGPHRAVA